MPGDHVLLRLPDWDYTQPAMYMITICVNDRTHRLGSIDQSDMVVLNDAGRMVTQEILNIPERFPSVTLDEFVVMPNHLHALIGLNLRLAPRSDIHLGRVVGEFKSRTTSRYIWGVKLGLLPRFERRLWQLDYYETIMRHDRMIDERRNYIVNNPANWRDDPDM